MVYSTREVEAAERDCRKAFEGVKQGAWVWHCHHETLYEQLANPPEERIEYILHYKNGSEHLVRLQSFRPMKDVPAELVKLQEQYDATRLAYDHSEEYDESLWRAYNNTQVALARFAESGVMQDHHAIEHPVCAWDGEILEGTW